MKVTITRGLSADTGTPGILRTEEGFTCDTQELPWRNNKTGVSCIMADTYQAELWNSPHFGFAVIRLEDKHGRADCLIHNGNFAGDTSKGDKTQVHGCTEVGRGFGEVDRGDGTTQHGILNSKAMLFALIAHLGEGPHEITYQWSPGCEPDDLRDMNTENRQPWTS